MTQKDTYRYAIPEGRVVGDRPEKVALDQRFAKFTLDVRIEGAEIVVRREFAWKASRVTAAEYQAFRDFCSKVDRAESEVLTLRKAVR